ncbi:MAG: hypothetical protein LBG27_12755 [Spirochaetaceae bacterium]|jgi:hypothetical protein|nr:hypothetical protein [Spirochaetaceae bacterium]
MHFLVIVPHRDCLKKIHTENRRRFAAGNALALSFPAVYPVMRVERPLTREQLKRVAHDLRAASRENGGLVLCGSKNAAAANLTIRKTSGKGFGLEWTIGSLVWLPKAR